MTDRQTWRDQRIEEAIEPDLPIIDAHHHLFEVPRRARLEPYMPTDLYADLTGSGHNIVATVYVDAFAHYRSDGPEELRCVGETVYADSVAQSAERLGGRVAGACAAIVAHGDLALGKHLGAVLDAHRNASPRFRGVRRMTIHDPEFPTPFEPGLLSTPVFRDGFAEIARRNILFEASVFQSQLADVTSLALDFPDSAIILDHIGTPLGVGRYAADLTRAKAEWRDGMAKLAECPNVSVKIGGLNMEFTGLGVGNDAPLPPTSVELAERQAYHILETITLFRASRCMFESNYPVDKWYTSPTVLWNSFKRVTADLGDSERADLFAGTARRVFAIA